MIAVGWRRWGRGWRNAAQVEEIERVSLVRYKRDGETGVWFVKESKKSQDE
jgi:hypothetical protein